MSEPAPLISRQPIFNRDLKVIGYELFARPTPKVKIGDAASTQPTVNVFKEIPIQKIVGTRIAFVQHTRTLIKQSVNFNRQQLIVEAKEAKCVDVSVLHSLKVLREQNYTIAIDDFVLTSESQYLIPYADIIKLDVLQLSPQQIMEHIRCIQPFGIQLLAKGIETYEIFEFCKTLGFDLFKGAFLTSAKLPLAQEISDKVHAALQLISAIHDPDSQIDKIERLIAQDTHLSIRILNLVNSAAFGATRKVESLKQAIMLLGINNLKNWVDILVLSTLTEKPRELSATTLIRARCCELLSYQLTEAAQPDTFFTAGLLSTLDAFLDMPLSRLLPEVSLRENIIDAILDHSGPVGKTLQNVIHCEKGEWALIDWVYLQDNNITAQTLAKIFLDAIEWVESRMYELGIQDK
jgi:c-di-GMP phosphodiesterase